MVRVVRTSVEIEGRVHQETVVMEGDEPAAWEPDAEMRLVGKPQQRIDGRERADGTARYTYDIKLPGMLYGAIARCPHPHARLVSIDTSAAEALPGVQLVLTHKNTAEMPWAGKASKIFDTELRHEGDEIAAVVANDIDTARRAVRLIRAEYEVLRAQLDPEAMLKPGAPVVNSNGNVLKDDEGNPGSKYERGDIERGWRDADVTVEGEYSTPAQMHNCLETHGCVASWEGDSLTVYESTQAVYGVRDGLARIFKLPKTKVRVIKNYMGGGFGSKAGVHKQSVIAVMLARQSGRPVQMMLDREAENLVAGYRNPTIQRIKLGARKDGTLTALSMEAINNLGAFGAWNPSTTDPARHIYQVANVSTQNYGVRTNIGSFAAFRAPGYVEGTVGLECGMDQLAEELGIDPLDLRLKNYAEHNQLGKADYTAKHLRECYERGAVLFGWREKRARRKAEGRDTSDIRRGYGMATQFWGGGGGPPAQAIVRINSDGSVDVMSGSQDLGTGTRTVFAQLVAEVLGLEMDAITVHLGDTAMGPFAPTSGGSMTVSSVGPAVRMAAEEAKKQLLQIAATFMDTSQEKLDIIDGNIVRQNSGQSMSMEEVLGEIGDYQITGKGFRGPNPEGPIRTWGVVFAEVTVDTVTGHVKAEHIVGVFDTGRVINPQTYLSQIEGGIIQGLGYALTEDRILDSATGLSLNPNLEGYKLPTIMDIPKIDAAWIDIADVAANHLGAKGIGEPPIIPTPAAIANAVADALGVRIFDLPITPARVLDALDTSGQ